MRVLSRRIGVGGLFLLVVLTLVPVALSGHRHAAHASTAPCATCLTLLHTPAMGAPRPAHVAPLFTGLRVVDGTPPTRFTERPLVACGRAPPALLVARPT